MSANISLLLLAKAAAPSITLIVIGLAWVYWDRTIKAIPATLLSGGIALLALMLIVVVAHTAASAAALAESVLFLAGLPLLVYAASLVVLVRRSNVSRPVAVACGLAGLIPLYIISGFVLIYTACSFGTGGC